MDTCNVWLSLFTVHLKLSAIPQYKIKSLKLKKMSMMKLQKSKNTEEYLYDIVIVLDF